MMSRISKALAGARVVWLATLIAGVCGAAASAADYDPPGRVARVNLLDGSGAMQPAGTDDWVDDLLNRPLTGGDKLWVDAQSRAEMHIGSTAIRLGSSTAVQVLAVDDRNVRLRLTAGSLSLRIRGFDNDDRFDIETPAGQISIEQPGGYRLDVDDRDEQTHVAVWSGQAAVTGRFGTGLVHSNEGAELYGGDEPAVELAAAGDTDDLDSWAEDRDAREDQSRAARYVSRDVVGYEELDDYGDWVVDPDYGAVWVPQSVGADWAPYRNGYWSWITPWGWTWIDSEPWGFAPCHYGRWVHRRRGWAWAPGAREERRPVYAPALVAWRGAHDPDRDHAPRVGWVPLGYNEVYEPAYRASRNYLRAVNLSNTRLRHGDVERYFDAQQRNAGQGPERRYANEAVPGAYTVVTRDTFTSARPVGHNRLQPAPNEQRQTPFTVKAPDIRPVPRSESRVPPSNGPAVRTDHPVFDRPVMPVAPAQWPSQRRQPIAPQPIPRQSMPSPVWTPRQPPVSPQSAPQPAPRQREVAPVVHPQLPGAYRSLPPPAYSAPPVRSAPPPPQAAPAVHPAPPTPSRPVAPPPSREDQRYDRGSERRNRE